MERRAFLASGLAAGLFGLAGCAGASPSTPTPRPLDHPGTLETTFRTNRELPADPDPGDGYPPTSGASPSAPKTPDDLPTLRTNGETVRLAPIDLAHEWHRAAAARFVDARGLAQYETAHVYGAVNSPAVQNSEGGGIAGWPSDDRIVCYCGCPHHLSSIRAAGLQKVGFTNVVVIDEGFFAWEDRDYPMAGTDFGERAARVVRGRVGREYAGEYVWAVEPTSGQQEAARIGADGRFAIHIRFAGVDASTPIRLRTPVTARTRPLGELVADTAGTRT